MASGGGPVHLCGVRLTPEGHTLLGVGPAELANRVVDLDAVLGRAAAALLERVRRAGSAFERFAILEGFLHDGLAKARRWDPALRWAVERTQATAGRDSIECLAGAIGWSRRRLHRAFVAQVGIGPKDFARVARFRASLRALDAGSLASLADTAYAFGYADQAHFAREFRALSGVTPSAYLRRARGAADGFVLLD